MVDSFSLFAHTFIIGIAVAAPVGAMGVLCMQRTLDRGWRAGAATGLGIATADAVYAGLAAFGLAAVSQALVTWQIPLRLAGGAALIVLGVRSILDGRHAPDATAEAGDDVPETACASALDPHRAERASARVASYDYPSAVALTLTNPMTIMAFGAVFAGSGLTAEPTLASAGVATLGVACGSLAWWLALVSGVTLLKHGIGDLLVVWVRRLSGAVITGFGLLALVSVFTR